MQIDQAMINGLWAYRPEVGSCDRMEIEGWGIEQVKVHMLGIYTLNLISVVHLHSTTTHQFEWADPAKQNIHPHTKSHPHFQALS